MGHLAKPRQIWHRQLLYSFVWLIACAELGLAAYQIHFTTDTSGTYGELLATSLPEGLSQVTLADWYARGIDPLIAELLAVSILTALTIPLVLRFLQDAGNVAASNDSTSGTSRHKQSDNRSLLAIILLHQWTISSLTLASWIMWLIGAAVATRNWLTRGAPAREESEQVLVAVVSLAWAAFATLTLARFLATLERGARKALEVVGEV